MSKKVKLTKEELLEKVDLSQEEFRIYTFEEMTEILKGAKVPPNSYKNVKVVFESQPLRWLYGVTGFSKTPKTVVVLVKGFNTETGNEFLMPILEHPIRLKVLEEPIPHSELYDAWY